MRYYGFKLGTNVEEIKENAKIELRHYGYDNVHMLSLIHISEPTRH